MSETLSDTIEVMLVDDSAVVRGFMTRIIDSDPGIKVVYSAHNGSMAIGALDTYDPDIILLDVEMPVMDGLTAIPQILQKRPNAKIIMCSTLTTQNASTAMKALSLGAVDCIAKPSATSDISQDTFRQLVLHKIRSIADGATVKPARVATAAANPAASAAEPKKAILHPHLPRQVTLRPANEGFQGKPQIVAVGSSTGGPKALFEVMKSFKGFDVPIVLTQHMPPTFTRILAEHITNHAGVPAVEAENGMKLEPGRVHVAPGGFHMLITQNGNDKIVKLDDGPMENFCKPAVDPMLRSLLPIYGDKILTVILTGMGQDGLKGARDVVARGGRIIAQDEATSVVWGMPGAVALAGICSAVLPLNDIGNYVRKAVIR